MKNRLEYPMWHNIDRKRRKAARKARMTPIEWKDKNKGDTSAVFAGKRGKYVATLKDCSCEDFNINLMRKSPCKHMIRLAMEHNLLIKGKMVSDKDAALYLAEKQDFRELVREGDLLNAICIAKFLNELYTKGSYELKNIEEIKDSYLRFFYITSADGKIAYPIRKRRKNARKTVKIATRRLGKWLLDDENAMNAALNCVE